MAETRARWTAIAAAALVAQIPFELRSTLFGLSNLQWTFLLTVAISVPLLLRNWRELSKTRLIQVAAAFVGTQLLAAAIAPEFQTNALKGALRIGAGFVLLLIARSLKDSESIQRVWAITAGAAALYAIAAFAGFGVPWLFRSEEFYIGQVQRLSGSFEYPNTAATYFAMSLPIVWWSSLSRLWKWPIVFLLWSAVTLTFSKGALIAIPIAVLCVIRSKDALKLVSVGIVAYVSLLPVTPLLSERVYGPGEQNPLGTKYTTPWNQLQQTPDTEDVVPLHIENIGITKWRSQGLWRVAVSYRWWNTETQAFLKGQVPVVTRLPHDVTKGSTVDVQAAIRTPKEPGQYILLVELFSREYDWFSQTNLPPALLRVNVQPSVPRQTGQTDLSEFYNRSKTMQARKGQPAGESLTASVPRLSLWRAALAMFAAHPLGVGPDNYRLQYGKYLGAANWNTQIHSNSLYLELLTGSGILGVAAFLLMALTVHWRANAVCVSIAVFLVHGLVDVFLMTTPIYFAFWMLMGFSAIPPVPSHQGTDRKFP